jgi:pimeloyl-ACP methyl ester carboxylesterase
VTYASLPDGGRLAYEVRGSGPNLLLVRPLGGSMLSWGRFASELAERTRVIQFDARGTGLSSPAPWRMTTRAMAHDARALLVDLGVERAHVYGISLGGMVASWLAIDSPERVGRVVLASTLPRGSMVRLNSWRRGLALARCLAQRPPEAEACLAEHILSSQFRAEHPDEVRRIRDAARARPASHRALLTLLLAAARHDVRERLSEIQARVHVLIGEYDPLLTIDSQRVLLKRLHHASYEVIRGAGHDVSAEAPQRTAERVLASLVAHDAIKTG